MRLCVCLLYLGQMEILKNDKMKRFLKEISLKLTRLS